VALIPLRCHTCGSRAEVELTEFEQRNLRGQGFITRQCKECRGNTRWVRYEAAVVARLADADQAGQLRGRVLLIDDDEAILNILQKALSRERFDLVAANSAREAITLLARGNYDVIVSDIRMPEFDGKELFRFLDRHMPELKEKVIFLTGDTGNPDTMQFLEEMQRPYLTKPIDMPALIELVRFYLPQA